jgi:cell division initiation protein
MLTPQEIQEIKFEKAVFGGYDMAQIDKFLDELVADYTMLYKENAALKAKMRVLVDKIDEYRAVDEEMRKALYTAQQTAKEITDKATEQARVIINNAELEARKKCESIDTEIYANALRLKEMRDICARYAESIKALLGKAAEDITKTESKEIDEIISKSVAQNVYQTKADSFEIELPDNISVEPQLVNIEMDEVEEPTIEINITLEEAEEADADDESAAEETEDNGKLFDITVIREEQTEDFEDDDGEEEEEEEEIARKPRFTFSELKFGKNYKNQD